jgi:ribosomal protein S18 acetylase RimI-like enzyme
MPAHPINLRFTVATAKDVAELIALHRAAAEDLTSRFGPGPWSPSGTYNENPLRYDISRSKFIRILIARDQRSIAGSLRLQTKKPWSIDAAHFSPVKRPLYLTSMAVDPRVQRKGVGRRLLEEAATVARAWPGDAIRLDTFDTAAGAEGFYGKCGYREVARVIYRGVPHVDLELLL